MLRSTKSLQSEKRLRPALLEGNRAGKLPLRVGKWLWPGAAAALGIGSLWIASHIEQQVGFEAPAILEVNGIDTSTLDFEANYRDITIRGVLPANVTEKNIATVLTSYRGNNGEKIRRVLVEVKESQPEVTDNVFAEKPPAEVKSSATNLSNQPVRVSAIATGNILRISGSVSSQSDLDLLIDAAHRSFQKGKVVNNLAILEGTSKAGNTRYQQLEQSINDLATVISNFDESVLDAHIDLDGDLLTGNITTASDEATNRVKAFLPSAMIGIITDVGTRATTNHPLIAPSESETQDDVEDKRTTDVPLLATQPQDPHPGDQAHTEIPLHETQPLEMQTELDQIRGEIENLLVFESGSARLQQKSLSILDKVASILLSYPDSIIEIGGHTDSLSASSYNLKLSQSRAESVAKYLVSTGISSKRLIATGFGENLPVASNETETGRSKNRRVTFKVISTR